MLYEKEKKETELSAELVDFILDDITGKISKLAAEDQLMAYEHRGFWQPMDTLRERTLLEDLWASGEAPWKTW